MKDKIMACKSKLWCSNLRVKCFVIGYLNLFASVVDIVSQITVVAFLTNGFQCDVTVESVKIVDWSWLDPFLVVVNLGTHGFYPFPILLGSGSNAYFDYMPLSPQPRCYPGILHVNLIDILNLMINLIWLKFAKAYVISLHRRDPDGMRMFFSISVVKLILQILYFGYNPEFYSFAAAEAHWFVKISDCLLALFFLILVRQYMNQVRMEKSQKTQTKGDQPPPYASCLVSKNDHIIVVKKMTSPETVPDEKKKVENV